MPALFKVAVRCLSEAQPGEIEARGRELPALGIGDFLFLKALRFAPVLGVKREAVARPVH
jgi:hypothetical protein